MAEQQPRQRPVRSFISLVISGIKRKWFYIMGSLAIAEEAARPSLGAGVMAG